MRKFKILSVLLVVVLLLSVVPLTASAAEAFITSEAELIAAGENGGEYTLNTRISAYETVEVNKDLTINFKENLDEPWNGPEISFYYSEYYPTPFYIGFKVAAGVTLTINSEDCLNTVAFTFDGTPAEEVAIFSLEANESSAAKVAINGCQLSGGITYFKSNATAQSKKPSIIINDGYYTNGTFLSGQADVSVLAGEFNFDPTEYSAADTYVKYIEYDNKYAVIKLDTEYSEFFKKNMNSKGEFVINRYDPSVDGDYDAFYFDCQSIFYDPSNESANFDIADYDPDKGTALAVYSDWEKEIEENHIVKLTFNYDADMKKEIDGIVASLPKGATPDTFHWYKASDLELVNYWLSSSLENESPSHFVNFSNEFKKAYGYKNYTFKLDPRMGGGGSLCASVGGNGLFMFNGVVYSSAHLGVEADHILYVPSDVADNTSAKKAAVQKKLDEFLGDDKVTVKETTVWESILYKFWLRDMEFVLECYPNATFEQFKNAELEGMYPAYYHPDDPEYAEAIESDTGITGVTGDTPCFMIEINGMNHYFLVECNSERIVETPKFQGTDATTDVFIRTDAKIPLDTQIQVEKLESGEEYDRIMEVLGVGENATYNIKLYSETAKDYITKLEDGTFEVRLPVPEKLKGKNLIVYYVDSKGNISEHKVTIDGEYAVFTTDHFSTYVLSEPRVINEAPKTPEDHKKGTSPETGVNMPLVPALAFVLMTVGGYFSLKVIKN